MLQAFKLGSSCVFAVFAVGSLAALFFNTLLNAVIDGDMSDIPLFSYVIAQIAPLVIGTELVVGLMTIFVPLTGRLGEVRVLCRFNSSTLFDISSDVAGSGGAHHCRHELSHELPLPLVRLPFGP